MRKRIASEGGARGVVDEGAGSSRETWPGSVFFFLNMA